MSDPFEILREGGMLSPLDQAFARRLASLAGEDDSGVVLAAALASRAYGQGDVCVDLARLTRDGIAVEDVALVGGELPALDRWRDRLASSPLVARADEADGGSFTPLVLDPADRLYLRRGFEDERRLAGCLLERARAQDRPLDEAVAREGLARLFEGEPGDDGPDWQRVAAAVSLLRPLCVITGGPGTGKTFTVAKVLALSIEQAHARGVPAPRIALLAPTGKAAAALALSIRASRERLPIGEGVREAMPGEARTLHRALGLARPLRPGETPRKLDADLVVVDEVSMVDLALMRRLLEGLRPDAQLVLLGDPDQLASVEAGAVLAEICGETGGLGHPADLAARIEALAGDRVPLAGDDAPLRRSIVRLERTRRYGADSALGLLTAAIRRGDAEEALARLEDSDQAEIVLAPEITTDAQAAALCARGAAAHREVLACETPALALAALDRFRILCAHRRGPGGVESVNRAIERVLVVEGTLSRGYEAIGRPVLVTRNAPELGLFNGDIGLVLAGERGPAAYFRAGEAAADPESGEPSLRHFAAQRLPDHEAVFAMSVHKSQGSEFEEVALVLPARPSPLATREVVYTGVSRAKGRVAVHASPALLRTAIATRTRRASGLADWLWGPAAERRE